MSMIANKVRRRTYIGTSSHPYDLNSILFVVGVIEKPILHGCTLFPKDVVFTTVPSTSFTKFCKRSMITLFNLDYILKFDLGV